MHIHVPLKEQIAKCHCSMSARLLQGCYKVVKTLFYRCRGDGEGNAGNEDAKLAEAIPTPDVLLGAPVPVPNATVRPYTIQRQAMV